MSGIMFVKLAQGRRQDFTFGPQKLSPKDARIEAPEAPRGLRIGEGGFPLPNRLRDLGERREFLSGVRGVAPVANANAFLAYLRPTEHF